MPHDHKITLTPGRPMSGKPHPNSHAAAIEKHMKAWSCVPESTMRKIATTLVPAQTWHGMKKQTVVTAFVTGKVGAEAKADFLQAMSHVAAAHKMRKRQLDEDVNAILNVAKSRIASRAAGTCPACG